MRRVILILGLLLVVVLPAWAAPKVALVYTAAQTEELAEGKKDPLALYRGAIEENGGDVIAFYQGKDESASSHKLEEVDAVLIPGGIDVDPKYYAEPPHEKLEKVDIELDELEFALLRHADARNLPVLGICRGEQIMNVHYGGSLIQDIPSQHEAEITVKHRYPKKSTARKEHLIRIVPGTRLHAIFQKDEMTVNTYHHQAVKRLGKGLIVSARAEDGIVEAIEREGERFVVGVQFHPEKVRDKHPEFNRLFAAFIGAVAPAEAPAP